MENLNKSELDKAVESDWAFVKNFVKDILDLKKGVDKTATIEEIKSKKSMAGANAWMLMCSIVIASIGLDRDSDAVIIGAMLISPLMSPILGIGLGIGVNDKEVLKGSILNFSIAIFIALVVSTLYFYLTPFGQFTPAIEARTEPNTLDVFVAIFGGMAGIISIARKDISTTLPGVAIATALMPPLCVTGYGIANMDWNIALNSFYLFSLNTAFISIMTYIIVRYLKFPYKRYMNPNERLRNQIIVAVISILIILPSVYILDKVLIKEKTQLIVKEFVEKDLGERSIYVDDYTTFDRDTNHILVMKVYGDVISQKDIPQFETYFTQKGLSNWQIQILNTSEVDLEEIESLEAEITNIRTLTKKESEKREDQFRTMRNSILNDSTHYLDVNHECKVLFPNIKSIGYGNVLNSDSDTIKSIPTIIIDNYNKEENKDRDKIEAFVKLRMKVDTIEFIYK